jgi:hypothetical protein
MATDPGFFKPKNLKNTQVKHKFTFYRFILFMLKQNIKIKSVKHDKFDKTTFEKLIKFSLLVYIHLSKSSFILID